jgi:hypothetical protein
MGIQHVGTQMLTVERCSVYNMHSPFATKILNVTDAVIESLVHQIQTETIISEGASYP